MKRLIQKYARRAEAGRGREELHAEGDGIALVQREGLLRIRGGVVRPRVLLAVEADLAGLAADQAEQAVARLFEDPDQVIVFRRDQRERVAGVLGAYLVMFPGRQVRVLMGRAVVPMSALIVIGLWIVIQIFSQITVFSAGSQDQGGVAYMAHIGGFVAGLVLAFLLGRGRKALPPTTSIRRGY